MRRIALIITILSLMFSLTACSFDSEDLELAGKNADDHCRPHFLFIYEMII